MIFCLVKKSNSGVFSEKNQNYTFENVIKQNHL